MNCDATIICGDSATEIPKLASGSIHIAVTFAGSGTTGAAAIEWNRNAILIEREPSYIPMIYESISKVQPMILT